VGGTRRKAESGRKGEEGEEFLILGFKCLVGRGKHVAGCGLRLAKRETEMGRIGRIRQIGRIGRVALLTLCATALQREVAMWQAW